MPLPPEPILRAAVRWLEELPVSGRSRCRALFSTHHDFSDLTPTQYDVAYSWLGDVGLLDGGLRQAPIPQQVFNAVMAQLTWFPDADTLVQDPSELPEDALRAAQALGLNSIQAFQHVHSLWRKVDIEQRMRIGGAGEETLVDLLRSSVAGRVDHVSEYSDTHGYDIEVTSAMFQLHIEAKATLRRRRLVIYLSRHEYETMVHDPYWQLVAVRLDDDLQAEAVCSVASEWIQQNVPSDRGAWARWEACRLSVAPTAITNGITNVASILLNNRSPLIDGSAAW